MNIDELQVAVLLSHRAGLSTYIHGLQGVGKSRGVKSYAENHFHFYKNGSLVLTEDEFANIDDEEKANFEGLIPYGFVDMRIAQMEASEIRGLPDKDEENRKVVYFTTNQLPDFEYINEDGKLSNEIEDDGKKWTKHKGILFADEINRGEDDVLNAVFQLVYDKRVEDYILPSGWCVVAAGNPSGSSFNVNSFVDDNAFKDRWCHVFIRIDDEYKKGWINYMNNICDNSDLVQRIAHFCMLDDGNFYNEEEYDDIVIHPSPRSWEFVLRLELACIQSVDVEGDIIKKVRMEMLRGMIGDVANHYDECSIDLLPSDIIKNGVNKEIESKLKKYERNQIQALSWGTSSLAKKTSNPTEQQMDNIIAFGKWIMTQKNDFRDLAVAYFDTILQSEQSENVRKLSLANKSLQNILRKSKNKNNKWYTRITDDRDLEKLLHLSHRGSMS